MKTIQDTLKEKFAAITDSLTAQDKAAAEKLFSRPTIDKYLSGDIVKIEVAEKLLNFFMARIKKRNKKIENI